ncbi:hypothetical protein [Haloactinomyces albus]|uniref:Uncharacterized protein n=1 Tax=Haloactinomyces albus TaxID=1352928 RepID=A0AAE4CLA1_9ACTN|nr:hypothetical protein [Haloactinomyces albus]MDR7302065.1 hypothetical protein [Haloactinomyces albus]
MQTTIMLIGALVPIMAASLFYVSDRRGQLAQPVAGRSEQDQPGLHSSGQDRAEQDRSILPSETDHG